MHDFLLPDQIRSRADQIGLTPHRLCEMSDVHPSTFSRILNSDVSWRVSTLRKLTAALTAHELALRNHLVALHGCEAVPAEAAEVPA